MFRRHVTMTMTMVTMMMMMIVIVTTSGAVHRAVAVVVGATDADAAFHCVGAGKVAAAAAVIASVVAAAIVVAAAAAAAAGNDAARFETRRLGAVRLTDDLLFVD